jgi:hypothetical protein
MAADKTEIKKRIQNDTDYVRCPKFSNSLTKFLAKNPDGVEDNTIARLLMIEEEQVEAIYQEAVAQLRESMEKEQDDE